MFINLFLLLHDFTFATLTESSLVIAASPCNFYSLLIITLCLVKFVVVFIQQIYPILIHVQPIDRSCHLLGLGYHNRTKIEDMMKAAVIHYNGQSEPWLDLGFEHLRPFWTKYN